MTRQNTTSHCTVAGIIPTYTSTSSFMKMCSEGWGLPVKSQKHQWKLVNKQLQNITQGSICTFLQHSCTTDIIFVIYICNLSTNLAHCCCKNLLLAQVEIIQWKLFFEGLDYAMVVKSWLENFFERLIAKPIFQTWFSSHISQSCKINSWSTEKLCIFSDYQLFI